MLPTKLACLSFLLLTPLAAQRGDGQGRGDAPRRERGAGGEVELKNFTYESIEMDGKEGAPRNRIGVYLPADYADAKNADKRYPWVVWLHGRNENQRKFHVEGGAQILDELRGKGEIPELILIAVSMGGNPIYVDGTRAGDQETLIAKTLVSYVEGKYRVAKDRTHRALMGVSIGGFGALKIAMRNLDTFGAVAAHSSAVFPADPENMPPGYAGRVQRMLESGGLDAVFGNPIEKDKWAREMPMALAGNLELDKLKTLRIYFDAGTDDRYGFAPPNEDLHKLLDKRGVPHTFELVQGGGHSWGSGSLQKQLVKSLKFIGEGFGGKAAAKTDKPKDAPANGDGKAAGDGK